MSNNIKYQPGTVQVATPRCAAAGYLKGCFDAKHNHEMPVTEPTVYLPHSCDEWVIGGREQVEVMIHDLQAILEGL